jgi:hypothetical protein
MVLVPVEYLDRDKSLKRIILEKRDNGFTPTPDNCPTYKIGICGRCKTISTLEFTGGIDISMGDRIMDGKTVQATCFSRDCKGATTDFVPAHKVPPTEKHFQQILWAQGLLDEAVRQSIPVDPDKIMGLVMERINAQC